MEQTGVSLAEVLVIHALLLDSFGGIAGITEQGFGKLEAAIAAPDVSMFGADLYPELPDKIAVLFFRLVRAHAFTDGNKRVALVAMLDVLERHGLRLDADEDALYEFVLAAANEASREEVTAWITTRIRPQTASIAD
jgi:death-on-curing protein